MTEGPGRSCYLDTNVFIGAFETSQDPASPILKLFERLRPKPRWAVTSELTLAELLAPSASSLPAAIKSRLYMDFLIGSDFIDLQPVTRDILLDTAELRQSVPRKLKLSNAIHLATAIRTNCAFLVAADIPLSDLPPGITWARPDAAGIQTVSEALHG